MATRPLAGDGLHFFTILASQELRSTARSRRRSHDGAFVNCWIDFKHYEGALLLAKFYIRQEGWRIRRVQEHRWITGPTDVARGSVRYFSEAKRDGASFVFHRYPMRELKGNARCSR